MPIYRNLWQVLKERGRSLPRESASKVGDLDLLSSRRGCIAPVARRCGVAQSSLVLSMSAMTADFAFLDADPREEPTGLLNGYGCSQASFKPTHRGRCSRFGARDPGERPP